MVDTESLVKKLAERIKFRRIEEVKKNDNIYIKAKGGKVKYQYLSDNDYADICALKDLMDYRYFDYEKLEEVLKAKRFKFKFLRKLNLEIVGLLSDLREFGVDYVAKFYDNRMYILEQEKKLKKQI